MFVLHDINSSPNPKKSQVANQHKDMTIIIKKNKKLEKDTNKTTQLSGHLKQFIFSDYKKITLKRFII